MSFTVGQKVICRDKANDTGHAVEIVEIELAQNVMLFPDGNAYKVKDAAGNLSWRANVELSSATNIAFGSGGGLLQKVNRDTQKWAFKCCAPNNIYELPNTTTFYVVCWHHTYRPNEENVRWDHAYTDKSVAEKFCDEQNRTDHVKHSEVKYFIKQICVK